VARPMPVKAPVISTTGLFIVLILDSPAVSHPSGRYRRRDAEPSAVSTI
jgi:hypothetical protein